MEHEGSLFFKGGEKDSENKKALELENMITDTKTFKGSIKYKV